MGYEAFSGLESTKSFICKSPALKLASHALHNSSIERFEGAVAQLGLGVFSDCESLEVATLSEGTLRFLSAGTFSGCSKLRRITLPHTLVSIDFNVFRGCHSLEEVYFEGTVKQWNSMRIASKAPRAAVVCSDGLGEW